MASQFSKRIVVIAVVVVLIISAFTALFLIDYGGEEDQGSLKVVASFYPLYFFASEVGGDRASVTSLIPNNMEPHSWNPKPSDVMATSKADVFIYNGAGFEPWAGSFLSQLGKNVIVVDTSQNVGLYISEDVEAVYSAAEAYLADGPYASVTMDPGAPYSMIEGKAGCYNLTLVNTTQGEGSSIWLNVSQPGDFRLFLDVGSNVILQSEDGTPVEFEMDLGEVSGHPSFQKAQFFELPVGKTLLTMSNSTAASAHLVIVVPNGENGAENGHDHGLNDPHFWIDPLSAKVQVDNIEDAFCRADSSNASYYKSNANDLKDRLDQLDQAFVQGLANRTKNDIITTHEGFDYMAKRYGFNAHAAIGISGDQQPSVQDMARLTDLVHQLGLHHVYSEPSYSDAIIEQISAQTGADVLVLDGVHGQSGVDAEKDYFEIMYANLESLKIGLEVSP